MPNETDKLFKTALDAGADVPPHGTAFDAEALWGDLDRHLRHRRRLTGGWVAAACGLLTLLAGLGWWGSFSEKKTTIAASPLAARNTPHRPEWSETVPPGVAVSEVATLAKSPVSVHKRAVPRFSAPRQGTDDAPEATPVLSETVPVVPPTPEPVVSPEPVVESVVAALVKPVSAEKKAVRSKPRFRVVHVNELPSSETIPLKSPRTEATARVTIGFPSALQPAVAETSRVFILTKKQD